MFKAEFCSRSTFFLRIVFMLAVSESESATPQINDPSESRRKAQTWFFRAFVSLKDGQIFSKLLDARKQQLESQWRPLLRLHQLFHGHVQTLLCLRTKIRIECIWRAMCTLDQHSSGIVATCVTREARNQCWRNRGIGLSRREALPWQGLNVSPHRDCQYRLKAR